MGSLCVQCNERVSLPVQEKKENVSGREAERSKVECKKKQYEAMPAKSARG